MHCASVHTAGLESLKIVLLKRSAFALDAYRILPARDHAGMGQSGGATPRVRRGTIGRRHEFRADGITDRLLENAVDLIHCLLVDVPADDVGDRGELIGAAR